MSWISKHFSRVWHYRRQWIPRIAATVFFGLATLLIFGLSSIDMDIQRALYDPDGPSRWRYKPHPLWWFTRHFGSLPALLTVLGACGVLIFAGRKREPAKTTWPYSIFLILALVLGPGLMVNLVLKPNWGRPRPRHVEEFKGHMPYEHVHQGGSPSIGRSFPCGHASAAFYLIALYPVLRSRRWARWVGLGGIAWGFLVGVGRMCDGAHFLSDVIWAWLIVYLVCVVLWYIVINVPSWEDGTAQPLKLRGKRGLAIGLGLFLVLGSALGVAVATPILKRVNKWADPPMSAERAATIRVLAPGSQVEVGLQDYARRVHFLSELSGFGVPGATHGYTVEAPAEDGSADVFYACLPEGYFTERESKIQVLLPLKQPFHVLIDVGPDGSAKLSEQARESGLVTLEQR